MWAGILTLIIKRYYHDYKKWIEKMNKWFYKAVIINLIFIGMDKWENECNSKLLVMEFRMKIYE